MTTVIVAGGAPPYPSPPLIPSATIVTTNTTIVLGELLRTSLASGSLTHTLPTAPVDGAVVGVKVMVFGGVNPITQLLPTCTLQCGGSDTINVVGGVNQTSLVMSSQAVTAQYYAADAVWIITADDIPVPQLDFRYGAGRQASLAPNLLAMANSGSLPVLADSRGPFSILSTFAPPAAMLFPNSARLPNGKLAVVARYANPGGNGTGQGVVCYGVLDLNNKWVLARDTSTQIVADSANATPLNIQQCYISILNDGRALLIYALVPQTSPATGNPYGMNGGGNGYVNPDGLAGNMRYMIGTPNSDGITFTWGTEHTIVTGFTASATTFDYVGVQAAVEVSTGNLVLAMCGSNVGPTWPTGAGPTAGYVIDYMTATYSPGGAITFAPISSPGTSLPQNNNVLNEISIAPDIRTSSTPAGFMVLCRGNNGGNLQQSTATGTIAQLLARTLSWSSLVTPSARVTGADPCLSWTSAGVLMFLSRITAATAPFAAGNLTALCVSPDFGTTWTTQALDLNPAGSTTYAVSQDLYGNVVFDPRNPGVAQAVYCTSTTDTGANRFQIRARNIFIGFGANGLSMGGSSGAFGSLFAQQALIGDLATPPPLGNSSRQTSINRGRLNPVWDIITPSGTTGLHLFSTLKPTLDAANVPVTSNSIHVEDMTTDGEGLTDSGAAYTPGVLYLYYYAGAPGMVMRYLRFETGAVAGSGTTMWVGIFNTVGVLLWQSAGQSTLPASSILAPFDLGQLLGAQFSLPQTLGFQIGWGFFGGTPPSLMGKTITQASSAQNAASPYRLSTAAAVVTSSGLPSAGGAQTPIGLPLAAGGGVKPHVQLCTA